MSRRESGLTPRHQLSCRRRRSSGLVPRTFAGRTPRPGLVPFARSAPGSPGTLLPRVRTLRALLALGLGALLVVLPTTPARPQTPAAPVQIRGMSGKAIGEVSPASAQAGRMWGMAIEGDAGRSALPLSMRGKAIGGVGPESAQLAPVQGRAIAGAALDEEVLEDALVVGIAMGIPGLSVAIGIGDELAWVGTAGYSDLLRRIPVRPEDRFGVGSITKTFVARVILQLVEEGKLDLEKTPQDYLDQPIVTEIPNTGSATLRHLLNHQSGIPTWEFQEDWIREGRGDRMRLGHVWGKTETLQYCTADLLPATNEPGQRYSYSNTNYTLLGLIIEAVTGHEAAQEIRSRILEPLGLENTFLESFEDVPGGYVHHYHYATPDFERSAGIHRGFPLLRPMLVESTAANLSPEWTAGGIVSSASDLVRWARAIRDGELLGPAMQKEVFTYYPPEEPRPPGYEYLQGIARTPRFFGEYAAFGHSGGTLGFTAYMYWLEGTDIIVVLLANVGGMHSGLSPSPVGLFFRQVWVPAVMRAVGRQGEEVQAPHGARPGAALGSDRRSR